MYDGLFHLTIIFTRWEKTSRINRENNLKMDSLDVYIYNLKSQIYFFLHNPFNH